MVNSPNTASLSHLESLWLSLLQPVGEGWESLCDYSATFTISLSPGELISNPNISGTTLLKKGRGLKLTFSPPCTTINISSLGTVTCQQALSFRVKAYFEFRFCLWPTLQWQMYPFITLHLGGKGGNTTYSIGFVWELSELISVKWISSYVFSLTSTQKKSPSSVCPSSIKLHMSYDYTYRTILFFGK